MYASAGTALDYLLRNFKEGLLFFYFSSIDQGSHMLWRYIDPNHPGYAHDKDLMQGIRILYQQIDEVIGDTMDSLDGDDTLIVMSDHGFSPFYWGVNLNSWLLEKGYVHLKNPSQQGRYSFFLNVDWSRTRAYALGLNGLYVNLRGREKHGIVSPGAEERRLVDQLEIDLLAMKDPRSGQNPVSLVIQPRRDFDESNLESAPDIVVGYNWVTAAPGRVLWEGSRSRFLKKTKTHGVETTVSTSAWFRVS